MKDIEVILRGEAAEIAALVLTAQRQQFPDAPVNVRDLAQVVEDSIAFSAPIKLELHQKEE